jgi:hypothetical protein
MIHTISATHFRLQPEWVLKRPWSTSFLHSHFAPPFFINKKDSTIMSGSKTLTPKDDRKSPLTKEGTSPWIFSPGCSTYPSTNPPAFQNGSPAGSPPPGSPLPMGSASSGGITRDRSRTSSPHPSNTSSGSSTLSTGSSTPSTLSSTSPRTRGLGPKSPTRAQGSPLPEGKPSPASSEITRDPSRTQSTQSSTPSPSAKGSPSAGPSGVSGLHEPVNPLKRTLSNTSKDGSRKNSRWK